MQDGFESGRGRLATGQGGGGRRCGRAAGGGRERVGRREGGASRFDPILHVRLHWRLYPRT